MLTEICQYLRNWFDRKPDGSSCPKYYGEFKIEDGEIQGADLVGGQYFRILGSLFNDGVHVYGDGHLTDETFSGAVWSLSLPPAVVQLAAEIEQWQAKYGSVDNEAMSPFQSESFGGYSYSKAGGNESTWQGVFGARLNPWRKI